MTTNLSVDDGWVPTACTLPTTERPLRQSEFDALFAGDVISVVRSSASKTRFALRPQPDVAARAAGLAAQEANCCSFFTFDLAIERGNVALEVSADETHEDVLASLTARAKTLLASRS